MAKTLIAYFSHAGQNYSRGGIRYLEVGNTQVAAEKLHHMIDSDLFYIDTVKKYPEDHMEKIAAAKAEYEANARPELTARVEHMEQYDTVILAYPNWWTTMPMALFTFLESVDLSGKTIAPFCTNEGSGMGRSEADIAKLCPGARVAKGLSVRGCEAAQSEARIAEWAKANL